MQFRHHDIHILFTNFFKVHSKKDGIFPFSRPFFQKNFFGSSKKRPFKPQQPYSGYIQTGLNKYPGPLLSI